MPKVIHMNKNKSTLKEKEPVNKEWCSVTVGKRKFECIRVVWQMSEMTTPIGVRNGGKGKYKGGSAVQGA